MCYIKIDDKVGYIKHNDNPLSADIGVITINDENWLFDVGNGLNNIKELTKSYNVVISHFHLDHIGNIDKININKLYVSKETYKHLPQSVIDRSNVIIVNDDLIINNLHIFKIPSSHAKGCLCLEIDNKYTFVGDALYCKRQNNKLIYNSQLLNEEIKTLKKVKSNNLLISHYDGLICNKDKVINALEKIYNKRNGNSSEIEI